MTDEATLAYYERAAPRYTATTAQMQARHLQPFLDRLGPGAYVLELGCGAGRDAAYMVERGFRVDATDGTRAMCQKARERFGIEARVMRFDELDAVVEYDAIWAHASLLHAPRNRMPDLFARIHRALQAGGWHFANYKLRDQDHPDEGRDPLGRWTNLPSPEWLLKTYRAAGFAVEDSEIYGGKGCDGVQRDWSALTLRKC